MEVDDDLLRAGAPRSGSCCPYSDVDAAEPYADKVRDVPQCLTDAIIADGRERADTE